MITPRYGNSIVSTHSNGTLTSADHLIKFLQTRTDYLVVIKFPLSSSDKIKPSYKVFKKGELVLEHTSKWLLNAFFINNIRNFFLAYLWSRKLQRKYKFKTDYFFGCDSILAVCGVALRKFRKAKRSIFYSINYSDSQIRNNIPNKIHRWTDKFAARRSDFVWSITDRMRKVRSAQGTKDSSNILTPNGIWVNEITINTNYKTPEVVKIEFHGYLAEDNGIGIVIKALDKIKETNFKLDIIGYGPYKKSLQRLVSKSKNRNRIQFLGEIPNQEIISRLSFYDLSIALISAKEDHVKYGDPMKVKEAMACQLPVLISNVSEVSEKIKFEKLGIVVEDSENISEIKEKLQDVLQRPQVLKRYRKNLDKVKDSLDWANIYTKALKHAR